MRKFFVLLCFACAILTTGCVNNKAIKQLNDSANAYLNSGEPQKALCRLQSSLELDKNIFETRYNLGVVYIELSDFASATVELEYANKLRPDNANVYFSLATAHEGLGYKIIEGDKNNTDIEIDEKETIIQENKKLTDNDKQLVIDEFQNAIKNYEKYLKLSENAEDKADVERQIATLNEKIAKYLGIENQNTENNAEIEVQ